MSAHARRRDMELDPITCFVCLAQLYLFDDTGSPWCVRCILKAVISLLNRQNSSLWDFTWYVIFLYGNTANTVASKEASFYHKNYDELWRSPLLEIYCGNCSIIQRAQTWFSLIGLYSFTDQMQLNRVFDCLDYIVVERVIDVANEQISNHECRAKLKTVITRLAVLIFA